MEETIESQYVSIYITRRQAQALAEAARWTMDKSSAPKPRAAQLRAALRTLASSGVKA